ncbi:hypothetical protein chiPu_0016835 [Chiloscyllium punctatum]|uniref:Uncharacterized protein n=1 Tax=Chiloscyllium punctatum TaxID=137246 RepID=A0A401T6M8_CHIPU|nr:hypothetical protein [Chiloscyllium punctatum]
MTYLGRAAAVLPTFGNKFKKQFLMTKANGNLELTIHDPLWGASHLKASRLILTVLNIEVSRSQQELCGLLRPTFEGGHRL